MMSLQCAYFAQVLDVLGPVNAKLPTLSFADLIVLAGTTALSEAAPANIT
jgi:catalase (peroxidase I)